MDLTKAARVVRLAQRFAEAINGLDLDPAPRRERRRKVEKEPEPKPSKKKAPAKSVMNDDLDDE